MTCRPHTGRKARRTVAFFDARRSLLLALVSLLVEQSATTDNPQIISFGTEGYRWPVNALYLAHRTLVDQRPAGGVFVRVKPGATAVLALNNLRIGGKSALSDTAASSEYRHNLHLELDQVAHDERKAGWLPKSQVAWISTDSVGSHPGLSLIPDREYAHPRGSRSRRPRQAGAASP